MSIEIRPVDVADEADVRRYWETANATVAERRYNGRPAWQATRTFLMEGRVGAFEECFSAWDGDVVVGVGSVSGSTDDNLDEAFVDVGVLPERRREGVGTRLLEHLVQRAGAQGRSLLTAETYAPLDATSPALDFAAHHGFVTDLEDGIKVADLQQTKASWPALAAEAAPHHRDYDIVTTWSPLPDHLAEGYCRISNRFYELAPSGELQREPEQLTVARLREGEAKGEVAGRLDLCSFAVTRTGEVVALTELFINHTLPHRSFQSGTIVLPEHRGHRLGLAIKLASHTALLERFPDVEWILTGNADVNTAMNAINDALGFRVVERCVEVTRRL